MGGRRKGKGKGVNLSLGQNLELLSPTPKPCLTHWDPEGKAICSLRAIGPVVGESTFRALGVNRTDQTPMISGG